MGAGRGQEGRAGEYIYGDWEPISLFTLLIVAWNINRLTFHGPIRY